MDHRWRFIIFDARTQEPQAEISLVDNMTFSEVMNAPGSFSATIPLHQPDGSPITQEMLTPPRAVFAVERDGVLLFAGPIWTHDYNLDAGTVTLAGEGYLSYLRRRVLRMNRSYTGVEQVWIAWDLINYTQNLEFGPAAPLGIVDRSTNTGVRRDRNYFGYERKAIGELIEELASVQQGFIFRFMPEWTSGGKLQISYVTQFPPSGRPTDTVFELGARGVALPSVQLDGTSLAYIVDALGQGQGEAMPISQAYDLYIQERQVNLDTVITMSDILNRDTLYTHAMRRLYRGRHPIMTPEIIVPMEYLNQFGIGDRITVRADHGILQLDGMYVVTQWDADIGADVLKVHAAPVEVFETANPTVIT